MTYTLATMLIGSLFLTALLVGGGFYVFRKNTRIPHLFIVLCLALAGMVPGIIITRYLRSYGRSMTEFGLLVVLVGMCCIPLLIGKIFKNNRLLKLDPMPKKKENRTFYCVKCGTRFLLWRAKQTWEQRFAGKWICRTCGTLNGPIRLPNPVLYRTMPIVKRFPWLVLLFCIAGIGLGLFLALVPDHSRPYTHPQILAHEASGWIVASAYASLLLFVSVRIWHGTWGLLCDQLRSAYAATATDQDKTGRDQPRSN